MLHEDERIAGYTEVEVWQASMLVCWNRFPFFFYGMYCASVGLPRQILLEIANVR